MNSLLPIQVSLEDRSVLVLGGGLGALEKVRSLLDAAARIRVIAPELCDDMRALAEQGAFEWLPREFQAGDTDRFILVFSATADPAVDDRVRDEVERRLGMVNVVDDPPRCRFVMPSVVRRGPIQVSVSTGGASPALGMWIRDSIGNWLDRIEAARIARFASRWRRVVRRRVEPFVRRQSFWREARRRGVFDDLAAERSLQAKRRLHELLEETQS